MKKMIIPFCIALATLTSCSNPSSNTENTKQVVDTATATKEQEEKVVEAVDIKSLFPEMPNMNATAKPGEHLLIPGYKMLQDYAKDNKKSLIYYNAKMATPADVNSKVAFTFDGEQEIPNKMIIRLEAGQKVKKGDFVLTWWQSGSGMQRAIVTDDSDPIKPEVHYLDIDWNNPAKNKGISIGQLKEQIKENTFTKLTSDWQSGTTLAVREGTAVKKYILINVAEDKVLALGFAGVVKVLDKANCTPLAINRKLKVGDKVQAPWVGSFKAGVVKEIKKDYGRAVIVFDHLKEDEHVIPFTDITTGLIL